MNIYFLDESRFGLLPYQHPFENFYLFGAYSPINANHFTLELPACHTANFPLYLNEWAKQRSNELKIVCLDNGAFHHSRALNLPDNIVLVFLPPYAPQRNPAEKIGRHLKDALAKQLFKTLDELSDQLQVVIQQTRLPQTLISITAYNYYIHAFNAIF